MNTKKEGEYYSQMVRRYKNENGGEKIAYLLGGQPARLCRFPKKELAINDGLQLNKR